MFHRGGRLSFKFDLPLAWPVSFCNLPCILTTPFACDSYGTHMEGEYRTTEMVMERKEAGRREEQSYERDHMPLLATQFWRTANH